MNTKKADAAKAAEAAKAAKAAKTAEAARAAKFIKAAEAEEAARAAEAAKSAVENIPLEDANISDITTQTPNAASGANAAVTQTLDNSKTTNNYETPTTAATMSQGTPATPSATELSKRVAAIAKGINAALGRAKSVRKEDKEEIRGLALELTQISALIIPSMDSQTVVSNIGATDLIASVREELRIFKDEITATITSAPAGTATYAAATAARPPRLNNVKTPVSRPAIIISSTDKDAKYNDVVNCWQKSVSFKTATYAPTRTKFVSNNKLKIEFDSAAHRDAALKRVEGVKALKAEAAKLKRPMLILKGISKTVDKTELIATIAQQNPSVAAAACDPNDLRLSFLRKHRTRDATLYNAVLEVAPAARLAMLTLGRINVDHQRVNVSDFSPFMQCFRCLQFGHTQKHSLFNSLSSSNCLKKDI